jgi:hypothetical protein
MVFYYPPALSSSPFSYAPASASPSFLRRVCARPPATRSSPVRSSPSIAAVGGVASVAYTRASSALSLFLGCASPCACPPPPCTCRRPPRLNAPVRSPPSEWLPPPELCLLSSLSFPCYSLPYTCTRLRLRRPVATSPSPMSSRSGEEDDR